MYFDKNPPYASGYNICKKCNKKFKVTTGVSTLRTHLKTHQLKVLIRKQTVVTKQKNPFDEEEQNQHHEYLIQWLVCNLQPFNIVDDYYFREFLKFFCPRYIILDRHKVKGKYYIENILKMK